MRIHLAVITALFLLDSTARAVEMSSEPLFFKDEKGGRIHCRLIKPVALDKVRKYPLVVHLHGAGERGTDSEKQLIHFYGKKKGLGTVDAEKQPYFAFVPQCPNDEQWVNVPWKDGSYKQGEISKSLDLVLKAVDTLIKEFPIDPDRIYITGLSMGGYGTWDAIQRRPDLFAAAVPICGAGDPSKAKLIAKLPIWAWHGDADTAVPVSGSRDMVAAIKEAGGEAKYTELKKVGHNSWAPAYGSAEMWEWLFKQKRAK